MLKSLPINVTICRQLSHTKDRYFELLGYLDWWDHNQASQKKKKRKSKKIIIVIVVET